MANEGFTVVGTNIAENAAMIWNVADMLRGPFKPHEYNDIERMMPITLTVTITAVTATTTKLIRTEASMTTATSLSLSSMAILTDISV